jgi:hypothetical protein
MFLPSCPYKQRASEYTGGSIFLPQNGLCKHFLHHLPVTRRLSRFAEIIGFRWRQTYPSRSKPYIIVRLDRESAVTLKQCTAAEGATTQKLSGKRTGQRGMQMPHTLESGSGRLFIFINSRRTTHRRCDETANHFALVISQVSGQRGMRFFACGELCSSACVCSSLLIW